MIERAAPGGSAANARAISRQASSNCSRGATTSTRPSRCASSASTVRPVPISSSARLRPTSSASRSAPPHAGMIASRTWANAIVDVARRDADVGRDRDLGAAAERVAVERGDDRQPGTSRPGRAAARIRVAMPIAPGSSRSDESSLRSPPETKARSPPPRITSTAAGPPLDLGRARARARATVCDADRVADLPAGRWSRPAIPPVHARRRRHRALGLRYDISSRWPIWRVAASAPTDAPDLARDETGLRARRRDRTSPPHRRAPGQFPFTRGNFPSGYRVGCGRSASTPASAPPRSPTQRYRYLLEQGGTGLSVALDLPTQCGYDSDDPDVEGEVGRVGVAIDTLRDAEILFDEIPLDRISTSFTINGTAAILLAFYVAARGEAGRPARGAARHDPERHPQGVRGARHLDLAAEALAAADRRHDRVLCAGGAALQRDLRRRRALPRRRRERRAGDGASRWRTASPTATRSSAAAG